MNLKEAATRNENLMLSNKYLNERTMIKCVRKQLIVGFLLLLVMAFPFHAQRKDCLPPVSLPESSEPNIFTEEQEVYLGDAVAEHIQKNYRVIEDQAVT